MRALTVSGLVLLLLPRPASGNGGPVDYTTGTAEGGIMPLTQESIALEREDLVIALEDDGKHYRVKARYTLRNPGAPRTVSYGVPLVWLEEENPDGAIGSGGALASTIEISMSSREVVEVAAGARSAGNCSYRPSAAAHHPAAVDPRLDDAWGFEWSTGWCVTKLEIPSGEAILTLRYRGELRFADSETSKSSLRYFDTRTLVYPLFPAGYWRGPVKRLAMRVEAGIWRRWAKVEAPAGAKRKGSTFLWDLRDVDLTKLRALRVTVDAGKLLRSRQLAHGNDEGAGSYKRIEASSRLAGGERYSPERMLDGKLDTAWCEGVKGPGAGEWIELRLPEPDGADHGEDDMDDMCQVEGLAIVPGYAKSRRLFVANGRVRKLRVSSCTDPTKTRTYSLAPLPKDPELAGMLIPFMQDGIMDTGDVDLTEESCWHLEILEVEPGSRYEDTCISELAVIVTCG